MQIVIAQFLIADKGGKRFQLKEAILPVIFLMTI